MTPRLLLALALPLLAGVASANEPWFDAAVKDWKDDYQPAEAWDFVRFNDEENNTRTLYCKKEPDRYNSYSIKDGCQLYVFPPSGDLDVRELQINWCGSDKVEKYLTDMLTLKGVKVSPYYVKSYSGGGGIISRRDRPDVALPINWSADSYYSRSGLFPWPPAQWTQKGVPERQKILACNGVIPWGRIRVEKPAGIGGVSQSPMSTVMEWNYCGDIKGSWASAPDADRQVARGRLPQEDELWYNKIDPSINSQTWNAGWANAAEGAKIGSYVNAASYHRAFRAVAKTAVENFGRATASSGAPKDRFSLEESRFLACRANHLNKKNEFYQKISDLNGDPGKTAAFVSLWRQYILRDLEQYLKDAAQAPVMPNLPENDRIEYELTMRFNDALSGVVPGVNAPQPAQAKAKPKIKAPVLKDPFPGEY